MVAQSGYRVARHNARRTLLGLLVDILRRRISAGGRFCFVSNVNYPVEHGKRSGLDHRVDGRPSTIGTSLLILNPGAIIRGGHDAVLYAPNLRGGESEFVGVLPVGQSVPLLIRKREFGRSTRSKLFAEHLPVGR